MSDVTYESGYSEEQSYLECHFCPQLSSLKSQYDMVNRALYLKYSSSQDYFYGKQVEDFIENNSTKKVVDFKDLVQYQDDTEYLSRKYAKNEQLSKIKNLTEYYKFHKEIPRVFMMPISLTLNVYHDKKRKLDYYKIKRMLRLQQGITSPLEMTKEQSNSRTPESISESDKKINPKSKLLDTMQLESFQEIKKNNLKNKKNSDKIIQKENLKNAHNLVDQQYFQNQKFSNNNMKIQNSICGDTINQLNNILKDMSVININDFDISQIHPSEQSIFEKKLFEQSIQHQNKDQMDIFTNKSKPPISKVEHFRNIQLNQQKINQLNMLTPKIKISNVKSSNNSQSKTNLLIVSSQSQQKMITPQKINPNNNKDFSKNLANLSKDEYIQNLQKFLSTTNQIKIQPKISQQQFKTNVKVQMKPIRVNQETSKYTNSSYKNQYSNASTNNSNQLLIHNRQNQLKDQHKKTMRQTKSQTNIRDKYMNLMNTNYLKDQQNLIINNQSEIKKSGSQRQLSREKSLNNLHRNLSQTQLVQQKPQVPTNTFVKHKKTQSHSDAKNYKGSINFQNFLSPKNNFQKNNIGLFTSPQITKTGSINKIQIQNFQIQNLNMKLGQNTKPYESQSKFSINRLGSPQSMQFSQDLINKIQQQSNNLGSQNTYTKKDLKSKLDSKKITSNQALFSDNKIFDRNKLFKSRDIKFNI